MLQCSVTFLKKKSIFHRFEFQYFFSYFKTVFPTNILCIFHCPIIDIIIYNFYFFKRISIQGVNTYNNSNVQSHSEEKIA